MTLTARCFLVALALLLALVAAVEASAQTHPCDITAPSAQTIASAAPHRALFCQPGSENAEAVIAWVDGQAVDLLPVTAKSAPSTSGLVLYETSLFIQVARGLHVLELSTYNRNALTGQLQVGAKSAPFSFAAVDETPLPTAPAIKGVTR
jgi:hypothetical protein